MFLKLNLKPLKLSPKKIRSVSCFLLLFSTGGAEKGAVDETWRLESEYNEFGTNFGNVDIVTCKLT